MNARRADSQMSRMTKSSEHDLEVYNIIYGCFWYFSAFTYYLTILIDLTDIFIYNKIKNNYTMIFKS